MSLRPLRARFVRLFLPLYDYDFELRLPAARPLVDAAGAGATVPLTGFGYTLAKGTANAVGEQGLLGVITGPFTAGAAGITTALLCGLVVSFITGPKDK